MRERVRETGGGGGRVGGREGGRERERAVEREREGGVRGRHSRIRPAFPVSSNQQAFKYTNQQTTRYASVLRFPTLESNSRLTRDGRRAPGQTPPVCVRERAPVRMCVGRHLCDRKQPAIAQQHTLPPVTRQSPLIDRHRAAAHPAARHTSEPFNRPPSRSSTPCRPSHVRAL